MIRTRTWLERAEADELRHSYVAIGYQYARDNTVDPTAPQSVRDLVAVLKDLDCIDDVCAACLPILVQPLSSSFVVYGVIDPLMLRLSYDRLFRTLVQSTKLFDLFSQTFEAPDARDVAHYACGLSKLLETTVVEGPRPHLEWSVEEGRRVLALLERISLLPDDGCDMIRDADVFSEISKLVRRHPDLASTAYRIVINAKFYDDTRIVDALLRRALGQLSTPIPTSSGYGWSVRTSNRRIVTCLDFAETCLRCNPMCRNLVVHEMVQLWRTAWNPAFGVLVAHQLDTSSVEFVVRLEQKEKLCFLIRACNDNLRESLSWRAVRAHLRRHWPGRVSEVLHISEEGETTTTSTVECPITHSGMRHPVVASDGHTYERDALLQHMVRNGAWSPMTREPLSYHLYTNRALRVSSSSSSSL